MKRPVLARRTKIFFTLTLAVLAGALPLEIGLLATDRYFFSPVSTSNMGFEGFGVGWANADQVKRVSVDLGIHVPSRVVTLNYEFSFGRNTTSQFLFLFPFLIRSVQQPQTYMNFSRVIVNIDTKNLSSSSQLQVVTVDSRANGTLQVVILMTAVGDLVSGARGSNVLSFPTDVNPPGNALSQSDFLGWNQKGRVYMASSSSYQFYLNVGLSNASVILSVYPSNYKPNPTNYTYPGISGPTEWLNWNMSWPNGVPTTIQFQNPTESRSYEAYAYWGGAGIAIGTSTLIAVAVQYLDPRRK